MRARGLYWRAIDAEKKEERFVFAEIVRHTWCTCNYGVFYKELFIPKLHMYLKFINLVSTCIRMYIYFMVQVYMHYKNLPLRMLSKDITLRSLALEWYIFKTSSLAGLYSAYRSMNHYTCIYDITNHWDLYLLDFSSPFWKAPTFDLQVYIFK